MRPTQVLLIAALTQSACSMGSPSTPPGTIDASPGTGGADAEPTARADGSPGAGADAEASECSEPSDPGCDCDPRGQVAAYELVVDDLSADRGQVEAAPGFDAASWGFEAGAWRQRAEPAKDRDDASFVVLPSAADDVLVEVTAASTDVTNFGDDLRQVLLTARASSSADNYEAVGCGIELELDGGGAVRERRVIAGSLSGSPSSVATNIRDARDYGGVALGQEFVIRMELRGGQMICQVTPEGESATFVQVGGFGGNAGAVGFHARETEAAFRDLHVCGLD